MTMPDIELDLRPKRFTLSCTGCKYVGRYHVYDLYVCHGSAGMPSNIVVKDSRTKREDESIETISSIVKRHTRMSGEIDEAMVEAFNRGVHFEMIDRPPLPIIRGK